MINTLFFLIIQTYYSLGPLMGNCCSECCVNQQKEEQKMNKKNSQGGIINATNSTLRYKISRNMMQPQEATTVQKEAANVACFPTISLQGDACLQTKEKHQQRNVNSQFTVPPGRVSLNGLQHRLPKSSLLQISRVIQNGKQKLLYVESIEKDRNEKHRILVKRDDQVQILGIQQFLSQIAIAKSQQNWNDNVHSTLCRKCQTAFLQKQENTSMDKVKCHFCSQESEHYQVCPKCQAKLCRKCLQYITSSLNEKYRSQNAQTNRIATNGTTIQSK